jgi:hypothetical protein
MSVLVMSILGCVFLGGVLLGYVLLGSVVLGPVRVPKEGFSRKTKFRSRKRHCIKL